MGVDGGEHGEGREGRGYGVEAGADALTGGAVLLEADGAGGEVGGAFLQDGTAAVLVVQEPQFGQQTAQAVDVGVPDGGSGGCGRGAGGHGDGGAGGYGDEASTAKHRVLQSC